ncbi:MAG: hypothetical protein ACOX50_00125 [Patescibacteria group bacterium]|jgi:hypothetical protein
MLRRSLPVVIIIILASAATLLVTSYQLPTTVDKKVLSNDVFVSARVGNYYIDILNGWTSPFAEVTLSGKKLVRKTTADERGFFQFTFIPVFDDLGELCLISQDVNQLPSFPVCLPPPDMNKNIEITNVYLPPTISVEADRIPFDKTTKASGMTTPDTEVDVHLFTENDFSIWARITRSSINLPFLKIIKTADAIGLPNYKVKSNENGHFEFSLPVSSPAKNGVFANTASSPKSNTLYFQTLGLLGILKLFLENFIKESLVFLASIKSNPAKIILLEILTLVGLIILILVGKIRDNRSANNIEN